MIDLKEWQKWFEKKGYVFNINPEGYAMSIALKGLCIVIYERGYINITGCSSISTKEGLWKLLNDIGCVK